MSEINELEFTSRYDWDEGFMQWWKDAALDEEKCRPVAYAAWMAANSWRNMPQDKALREARQTIANGELSADCCAERSSLEDAKQVLATLESLLPRESGGGK